MLHDLDRTIEKILRDRGGLKENEIDISFEQPTSEWSATISRPTINCWGFDLRENLKLRNMEMEINRNMKKREAHMRMVPMRLDVTYLITAWARKAEDEHQLLWRALAALAHYIALDPEQCEGGLKDQPYDIPVMVAQVTEAAQNITDVWSVLDNEMKMGFTFVATLALDLQRVLEAPLVLEGRLRFGQSHEPAAERVDFPEIFGKEQAERYQDGIPITPKNGNQKGSEEEE
ncbi:MAG TPA: Pvc16 family protein [Spirillospora sp.]|nr:Pvc16 family protein [Spirillospora sp.]